MLKSLINTDKKPPIVVNKFSSVIMAQQKIYHTRNVGLPQSNKIITKAKVNDLTLTISKNEKSPFAAAQMPSAVKDTLIPMKTFGFKSKIKEFF